MKFQPIHLGQSVLRYQVPLDIFNGINNLYENVKNKLPKANKKLVGKIKSEFSLLQWEVDKNQKQILNNFIPANIISFFEDAFKHYLEYNNTVGYEMQINAIWVNEMRQHEYNPAHIHKGGEFTGLSSVMILKLPSTYGVEYSSEHLPQNGRLQILGAANGQFAKIDYEPPMQLRDFYIFPYDMRHVVYPFNGTDETRLTLAANCDVKLDPIKNRGVT
tara:strand:- start:2116 stop:2769 length:654 start_codon:yes stop_codon:yes gene_type:complete